MDLTTTTTPAAAYNDFSQFSKMRLDSHGHGDDLANLKKVAGQFEAIFVQMLLKSMRDATDTIEGGLFDSNEMDFYRDMFDEQISLTLSEAKGMGLAEDMVRQLAPTLNLPEQVAQNSLAQQKAFVAQRTASEPARGDSR